MSKHSFPPRLTPKEANELALFREDTPLQGVGVDFACHYIQAQLARRGLLEHLSSRDEDGWQIPLGYIRTKRGTKMLERYNIDRSQRDWAKFAAERTAQS